MTEVSRIAVADGRAMDAWFQLRVAWAAEMPYDPGPCRVFHNATLTHPWPDEEDAAYLATVDHEPVGFCTTTVHHVDNRDVLGCELVVHPRHRRQGHGAALLDKLIGSAHEHGCTRLLTELPGDGPGASWALAHGAREVLPLTHHRLDLTSVDQLAHDAMLADARSRTSAYTVVQWTSPTPEEHLAALGVLEGKMSTDPPTDDLSWEPEVYDADRMGRRAAMIAARGMRQYTSVARHEATGELVGSTTLTRLASVPEHIDQWETIVLEEHRGHRLGLLLKLENLHLAQRRESQLRYVDTVTANSNHWMRQVNGALGFVPLRPWSEWELAR